VERQYRRAVAERVAVRFTHYYPAADAWHAIHAYPAEGGGLAVFYRDVTAEQRAEAERERLFAAERAARAEAEAARRRADEANRAKGEFLAVMSHELRTPLNAIGGYAELLEMGLHGPVTPEQRTALDRIQRSQRHLLGLINGVLNYAKVDAGAVHYALEEVRLDEVLATCEALVAPQARAKGLALDRAACAPGVAARADREKVQQVVLNLLSNAVKFTRAGGRVTLACAADGGVVRVRVVDTGRGIAADQLERVFQPFVQVDATLTRTHEGTGLGLAISRDLARGMGGDLTAESAAGVGSTFTLTLPAAEHRAGA
jgi:signal transduction histidine kinase